MLKKADDLQTALLDYRNTPPQGHTPSPAQRMLCRRTRTTLPTPDHLLKPSPLNPEMVAQELSLKRTASKQYYDRSASKTHSRLRIGSRVYAKPPATQKSRSWICGTIISRDTPRSYTIQTPINSIRRNRVHIKPAAPQSNLPTLDSTPPSSCEPNPPSRNFPIASPTEENSNHSAPPVQTLLQQPATETATPSETEGPATRANTGDNTENPASETNQVRPLRPTPESTTSETSPENTRTRTRIIKPPSRFRDYELT